MSMDDCRDRCWGCRGAPPQTCARLGFRVQGSRCWALGSRLVRPDKPSFRHEPYSKLLLSPSSPHIIPVKSLDYGSYGTYTPTEERKLGLGVQSGISGAYLWCLNPRP